MMSRRLLLLAHLIRIWSLIGWVLDTPFRLPYVWAVDRAGLLTDEGEINRYRDLGAGS